jgi:hypothetical protein
MMVSVSINSALTPHFIFEDVATDLMNIESMEGRNQFVGRERRLRMIKKHQLRNGKNYVGKKLPGTQLVATLDDGVELAASRGSPSIASVGAIVGRVGTQGETLGTVG